MTKRPSAAGGRSARVTPRKPPSDSIRPFCWRLNRARVYHGFAAVAQIRFRDTDFADELFRIARKQPNPLKSLNADYGRVLLIAKRPREAQPVLEQAVKDTPDFRDAWTNLAWARLQNGDPAAACVAADEAARQRPSAQRQYRSDRLAQQRAMQMSAVVRPH